MKRGDLVAVVFQGDFGKPRPALIVQSDLFNLVHPTTTVLPLTGDLRDVNLFRITVEAFRENGLRRLSQIMVDKAMTLRHDKIGAQLGRVDEAILLRVNRSLAVWMDIALATIACWAGARPMAPKSPSRSPPAWSARRCGMGLARRSAPP